MIAKYKLDFAVHRADHGRRRPRSLAVLYCPDVTSAPGHDQPWTPACGRSAARPQRTNVRPLTVRAMARASGVLPAKAQIWQAAGLTPHRVRRFKLSTDSAFAAPVEGVVGLYVAAPKHAVVLSLDEKSHVWMAPGPQEKS